VAPSQHGVQGIIPEIFGKKSHPRFSRRLPLPVSEIFQPTSEIIWDTFTLEVPRWLYDYFSLGVFYILTCCVWFVYDL